MTTKKLTMGIIGAGGIAQIHIEALRKLPNVDVVAVADVVEERAEETAQKWGVPNAFQDYRRLLDMKAIDAVTVATFNQAHAGPTIDALHAGKHVLLEKPMAAILEDAVAMVRAARETGNRLSVGMRTFYNPPILAARDIVKSGALGHVYYAEAVTDRRRGIPGRYTFIKKETAGLGAVADIGVYALAEALFILGWPTPVSVTGMATNAIAQSGIPAPQGAWWDYTTDNVEVEEFGAAWVRFADGLNMVFKTSWAMHMDTLGGTLFCGTRGGLRLDPFTLYRDEFGYMTDAVVQHVKSLDFREMFVLEHAAFIEAILEDLPTPIPGEEFLVTQVIIQGVIDSAATGREVAVHMPEV